ncbi:short-chain alcohol dehydrogenase-like protein [Alcanivorax hongdengensis A-11-3]|uniref:Short-chain alcohol dehydrogenase-like protein n=1 Tax=Alcanivorax hongdengensis A-11-3 TaxID=1177179 RepID=L0WCX2_9GAMM|nr:SDR family oxidoreductase [Alcanivorax hongdengensis]EKF74593.1 short-chain alcohol dehydrogenase-like protein [Alcanivorax hongdengensis A-11-3]
MSQTIVITGANRGIGLAMARCWAQRGDRVIAACRQPSQALADLGVEIVDGVDVSRRDGVTNLEAALGNTPVDVLYNNAGIMLSETLDHMDLEQIEEQFQINTLGPLRVTLALLDNLKSGSKVGLMTSRMGSIADNGSGGKYGYRISKAGLNAAGKSLAIDLYDRGIAVAILHPGWVKTDMTGNSGHLTTDEAAAGLVQRMDELTLENSGTFWHSDGSVLPW